MDSLKQKNLSPEEFAQKADSLRKAFAGKLTKPLQAAGKLSGAGSAPTGIGTKPGSLNSPLPNASLSNLPKPADAKGLAMQYSIAAANAAAVKQLPGHQQELRAARRELGQYRKRLGQARAFDDSSKAFLKPGSLRGKAWQQRVVIGSLWQFSRQHHYFVELGPSLAWQFNKRLSAGAGFQYRLNFSDRKPWLTSSDQVLGYYGFSDVQIKKGFFGRLHYESLRAYVPRPDPLAQKEVLAKEWVEGLSLGLGKSYGFYKSLKGYALLQYNILYQREHTPYLRPLQAKIGFYLTADK